MRHCMQLVTYDPQYNVIDYCRAVRISSISNHPLTLEQSSMAVVSTVTSA